MYLIYITTYYASEEDGTEYFLAETKEKAHKFCERIIESNASYEWVANHTKESEEYPEARYWISRTDRLYYEYDMGYHPITNINNLEDEYINTLIKAEE